jgi:hypothetical protein
MVLLLPRCNVVKSVLSLRYVVVLEYVMFVSLVALVMT